MKVQHFFVCRLESMDPACGTAPRWTSPAASTRSSACPSAASGIAAVHLVPLSLRHYLDGNIEGVRAMHAPDLG